MEYQHLFDLFKGQSPKLKVMEHDSSTTGLRYKLRVELPIRLTKKHDIGGIVLDISNALYRNKQFKYAYCPSVEVEGRGRIKQTVFYYYFNDTEEAIRMGFELSDALKKAYLRHEAQMAEESYPNFVSPYRKVA